MEQSPRQSQPNEFLIEPREILMNDDERDTLALETGALIDETFAYRDYSETTETFMPVELYARPDKAPNSTFRALIPRAYDRAFVTADTDHADTTSYLCHANISLFKQGLPISMRTELVLLKDEFDEEAIDINDPRYFLKTPSLSAKEAAEIIPLDAEAVRDILHGLLQQSDSAYFQDSPGSFQDMIHALLLQSPDAQIKRATTCRVAQEGTYGDTTVAIKDATRIKKGHPSEHLSHSASVKIFQPFAPESGAITSLNLTSSSDGTTAAFGVKRTRHENENYTKTLHHMTDEYNDPDLQYPNKFSTQMLRAIQLIRWPPEGATVEQWLD